MTFYSVPLTVGEILPSKCASLTVFLSIRVEYARAIRTKKTLKIVHLVKSTHFDGATIKIQDPKIFYNAQQKLISKTKAFPVKIFLKNNCNLGKKLGEEENNLKENFGVKKLVKAKRKSSFFSVVNL